MWRPIEERVEHLQRLRDVQDETERVHRRSSAGPSSRTTPNSKPRRSARRNTLRMQALSRVFLDNFANVQSSWVTQGPKIGQIALKYGAR